MATANLNNDPVYIDDGMDSIIVIKDLGDIPGGRTLNVANFAGKTVIKAGHIIVADDTTGVLEPLAIDAGTGTYVADTTGKTYKGVLKRTILTAKPMAAILTIGQVNAGASPYAVTAAIKAALPRIEFL